MKNRKAFITGISSTYLKKKEILEKGILL